MQWVGIPIDLVERLDRAGLSRDDRLLALEGYLYAGQYLTDGAVTARLAKVSDHPDPETAAGRLIEAGVWEQAEDGYTIVDYSKVNLSRAEVERRREDARNRQERSRKHRAGDHSRCIRGSYCPDGAIERVTSDVTSDVTRESHPYLQDLHDLPDLHGEANVGQGREGSPVERASADADALAGDQSEEDPPPRHEYRPSELGVCATCSLPPSNRHHLTAGVAVA